MFILGLLVIIVIIWTISTFNRLIQLKHQVSNAWGQIDVQLQRRHDLIPNLVECVKGYMEHEKATLESVIHARNAANDARVSFLEKGPMNESIKELITAENALNKKMVSFLALTENYPDLKASTNMRDLQEELSSTENKVSFSRQVYNDLVMTYNTKQEEFPAFILAKKWKHHKLDPFEIKNPEHKDAPKVTF
jgi:LemA protein